MISIAELNPSLVIMVVGGCAFPYSISQIHEYDTFNGKRVENDLFHSFHKKSLQNQPCYDQNIPSYGYPMN